MKRFYTFNGVANGSPPATRIVKRVNYYSYLEFDPIEACIKANGRFFEKQAKDVMKLLLMPFDINNGYAVACVIILVSESQLECIQLQKHG
jgi:hypothetical protein